MRIIRFDPEIAALYHPPASSVRAGALLGPGAVQRVDVVHFGPDGTTGGRKAAFPVLLAVVAGAGWVSGAGGHRPVATGYGALFEAGEEWEAGSGPGMTAVLAEGTAEVWALLVSRDIVVEDYDPRWPSWFDQVQRYVWPSISALALRIDHVGSTAIPGLAAKPIIDMDIVVPGEDVVGPVTAGLEGIGYRWRGDLGVPGRQAFAPPPGVALPAHHLYLVVDDNKAHLDHWLLRDLLRRDPEARDAYGRLKRANAEAAGGDLDWYVAAKAGFVAGLLARARAERGLPPAEYWAPELPPPP